MHENEEWLKKLATTKPPPPPKKPVDQRLIEEIMNWKPSPEDLLQTEASKMLEQYKSLTFELFNGINEVVFNYQGEVRNWKKVTEDRTRPMRSDDVACHYQVEFLELQLLSPIWEIFSLRIWDKEEYSGDLLRGPENKIITLGSLHKDHLRHHTDRTVGTFRNQTLEQMLEKTKTALEITVPPIKTYWQNQLSKNG